jgi:3-phosphoshikimate 1-carboxyvinyltransferase
MPVASAQVKSCILLAALFAEGETTVIEPAASRDHTEKAFQMMGIPLAINGNRISLGGYGQAGPVLKPVDWKVPGDFSSAAFWLAAASSRPGSKIIVKNVGLNPSRTAFLNVLRRMGAQLIIDVEESGTKGEPAGGIVVKCARLKSTAIGGDTVPNIIDELPLVAVLGALAEGETVISGARELRVKESDRIASLAANLRLCGVSVEEKEDGMIIRGVRQIRGNVSVESFGDHRIAMAFAVLALSADGPVTIRNIACVATSYPSFWEHLKRIGADVRIN